MRDRHGYHLAICHLARRIRTDARRRPAVTARDHLTLAVLIRQTQWLLDDVAHDLPAGRVSPEKGVELAAILESLAALVRQHTGLVVIDAVCTDES